MQKGQNEQKKYKISLYMYQYSQKRHDIDPGFLILDISSKFIPNRAKVPVLPPLMKKLSDITLFLSSDDSTNFALRFDIIKINNQKKSKMLQNA